ncbi:hypothetical protein Taro_015985, partial [Colocasia esculenta]|nr:hypothetical protein [Colocasia esculenta]
VFKGESKVRLLPLSRLRSRKTKNPSLHPLKKKATTTVSRSGRRRCLRRVHIKALRHQLCRVIRYAFLFILPFQGDNKGVAIRVATHHRSQSEHSLEGLRKSPLTVDSHTVAGLVVPVAT